MIRNQALAVAIVVMTALSAGAAVNVEKGAGYPEAIRSLAVAPLDCKEGLACEKIEQALMDDVAAMLDPGTVRVITPEEIRQEMADNPAETASVVDHILAITRRLGCDAVLLSRVGTFGSFNDTATTNDYTTGIAEAIDVLATDGRVLMRGWASVPTHPWQHDYAVFAKVHFSAIAGFQQILAKSLE